MSDIWSHSAVRGTARTAWGEALLRSGRIHRPLYAVALLTLALAAFVGSRTGNQIDFAAIGGFGRVLGTLFLLTGIAVVAIKAAHLVFAEKATKPWAALLNWMRDGLLDDDRALNAIHTIVAANIFVVGFGVLKGAIGILQPFHWDAALMAFDRTLHFGNLPHEWLGALPTNSVAVGLLDSAYNLWYFILLSALLVAGFHAGHRSLTVSPHRRFLLAFLLTWLVGGVFVALGFSSAGPCYYALVGAGEVYASLMANLNAVNAVRPLVALETQSILWNGYVGLRDGSVGIAAFPSMHVATAVLIALYASTRSVAAALGGWAFAAIIMLGSVVLGWHYAVDGYAGGAIAAGLWWVAGRQVVRD